MGITNGYIPRYRRIADVPLSGNTFDYPAGAPNGAPALNFGVGGFHKYQITFVGGSDPISAQLSMQFYNNGSLVTTGYDYIFLRSLASGSTVDQVKAANQSSILLCNHGMSLVATAGPTFDSGNVFTLTLDCLNVAFGVGRACVTWDGSTKAVADNDIGVVAQGRGEQRATGFNMTGFRFIAGPGAVLGGVFLLGGIAA